MTSRFLHALAASFACAATASAQVTVFTGPSPNIAGNAVDFDNPLIASGPVPAGVYTGTGITSVTQIGGGWTAAGDVLSAGLHNGQVLVSQGGVPAIAGANEALDNLGAGDGWEIVLDNPADEFQCGFPDQTGMQVDVELLLGATSLGTTTFAYAQGAPNLVYFRATGSQFDTVRLTSPLGSGGYGLDDLGFGNGPGPTAPANDTCATATTVMLGATAFDNLNATTTQNASCSAASGADVWFEYTATSTNDLIFDTCGSAFDTVMEVFTNGCASQLSLGCNDDTCALQSQVRVSGVTVGTSYLIQLSGFNGAQGTGTLNIAEAAPPSVGCLANDSFETGDVGGWTLVDHPVPFLPAAVRGAGQTPGFNLFASAPTEGSFCFTHGFDGGAAGVISLSQTTTVTSGLTPLAFDYRAGWDMLLTGAATIDRTFDVVVYDATSGMELQRDNILTATANTTNTDTGPLSDSVDLSMFIGQSVRIAFEWNIPEVNTGPGHFQLDNITCAGGIGVNYCGPAVANSSGAGAVMGASGSAVVASNNLVLECSSMPDNSFGFFLTSMTQGSSPQPGGSLGVLCLGGQIGRYVGSGQVQNSGTAGSIALAVDLTQHPTPTGLVSVNAGETWYFTAWFRDTSGGMAVSNFADGLQIDFN